MASETTDRSPGDLSMAYKSHLAGGTPPAAVPESAPDTHDRAKAITFMVGQLIVAFDLNASDVAAILGVSASFMSKLRREQATLAADSHPYQNAVLFVRAMEALNSLLGIRSSVRRYLYEPHATLGGRPIKRMHTPEGLVDVTRYLESFVH